MFRNEFRFTDQLFSEGHQLITRGTLFFGAFAVILAGLIFLFPAFIGILVAISMLLAGLIALVAGYRFWKLKDKKTFNLRPLYSEFSEIHSPRPRHYHFQTIRFTRW
jgi:predicted membrane protein